MQKFMGQSVIIAAPVAIERKGEFIHELTEFFKQGYYRCVIDGVQHKFKHVDDIAQLKLKKTYKHTIDILIDSFIVEDQDSLARLQEGIQRSFAMAEQMCKIMVEGQEPLLY